MFFLGGLNTVFPHLIYLTLIWVFLIIGFSGKINLPRTAKLFHEETSFRDNSGRLYQLYQVVSVPLYNETIDQNSTISQFTDCDTGNDPGLTTICTKYIENVSYQEPGIFRPPKTNGYRGPPLKQPISC